ncbi:QueT transporter family protein [Methanospirillum hungatei]|uniref:QueT transporter family protein n=1 Tax=Methanospirillum hungatei TaxID=2203 RepID=UPI0026ECC1EE|nr:QueT transporter family protein [Methanospirillum hungatei]MCA1915845.1 QueT transporter family protein [Methanospirillum hungatei]
MLFGPAGAWGCGLGSVISDLFGTLSPGTLFGFLGNFAMAFVPYYLWRKTGLVSSSDPEPFHINTWKKRVNFILFAVLCAIVCTLIIAWGLQLLGLMPFMVIAVILLANNLIPTLILSLPLMLVLYPRIKSWGLFWTDVMGQEGTRLNSVGSYGGTIMIISGICLGYTGGIIECLYFSGSGLISGGIGIGMILIGSQIKKFDKI